MPDGIYLFIPKSLEFSYRQGVPGVIMAYSDEFFKRTRKTDEPGHIDSAFSGCMPCPEEMSQEICSTLRYEVFRDEDSTENREKYKTVLGCIIDLFDMDYNEKECILTDGIWEIIRDITNAYALELDEDLMTYVFQQIMSRGLI